MDRRTLLGRAAALGTALLAGCAGAGDGATPTETASPTSEPTPEPTQTAASGVAQTVDVGPSGALRFEPANFTIEAGDTVRWTFRSSGHNVKADGASWTGTPGEQFDTLEVGATYEHTFTVAGDYDYFCAPHQSAGMVGSFTVEA